MVAYKRTCNLPYAITLGLEDVNEICNKEKTVPVEWITREGSDISDDFIIYALDVYKRQPSPCVFPILRTHGIPVDLRFSARVLEIITNQSKQNFYMNRKYQ